MARIFTVADWEGDKEVGDVVRAAITSALDDHSEGFVLPGAYYSSNSHSLRNVVLAIDSASQGSPYRLMSAEWGHGIGVIRLPHDAVEQLLVNKETRRSALRSLRTHIRNEIVDSSNRVGPRLACSQSRDAEDDLWEAGFDSESCCVGIYSAVEDRTPTSHGKTAFRGTSRGHLEYYLVVKAGGGQCSEEFHTAFVDVSQRLGTAASLDIVLKEVAQNSGLVDATTLLKRVASAGRRNRSRIAYEAAERLGLIADIDSVLDHASSPNSTKRQTATLLIDTVTNLLERPISMSDVAADRAPTKWIYFAGSTAPVSSQGIVLASNVAEGFVVFEEGIGSTPGRAAAAAPSRNRGTTAIRITNEMYGALPAGSEKNMEDHVAIAHSEAAHGVNGDGHPDREWIADRFVWHTPQIRGFGAKSSISPEAAETAASQLETPQLWGTHLPLSHNQWARALCAHQLHPLRLRPELVLLAGAELSKIRGAVRKVASSSSSTATCASVDVS
jgi:hypothetical protein